MDVKIYCDGSCLGNGKAENFGGYGIVVVVNGNIYKEFNKGKINTTNNEMELMGVLAAVKLAKTLKQEASIYCDSAYVVNTINEWMGGWAANGWIKKSDKKAPENLEIIQQLYDLLNFDKFIKVIKVKGHADNKYNNRADKLAVEASVALQTAYLHKLAEKRKA